MNIIEFNWLSILLAQLALLEVGMIFWFRRRKAAHRRESGNGPSAVASIAENRASEPLSMKAAGRATADPAEIYLMIEEAEHYATHGRLNNAVGILKEIVGRYPQRVEAWLLLLSAYRNKRHARQFEYIAGRFLASTGDHDCWTAIQEAGRSIDPGNSLYDDAEDSEAADAGRMAGLRRGPESLFARLFGIFARASGGGSGRKSHTREVRQGMPCRAESPNAALCQPVRDPGFDSTRHLWIGDVLVRMGAATEQELDHLLMGFDHAKHGYFGNHLVDCGLITKTQLNRALLLQLSDAMRAE